MKGLYKAITTHPVIYVTRDLERAVGMAPEKGYFIIANDAPYAREIQSQYPDNVWLIAHPEGELYDTHELLCLPEIEKVITENTEKKKAALMVFKSTSLVEEIARSKKWKLLNPTSELAEKIENKVTQVAALGNKLDDLFPLHKVLVTKNITWDGIFQKSPFILQWAHSHSGDGTLLIKNEKELKDIVQKFPEREARVTQYIRGPMFTSNIVVSKEGIIPGNISYQITGTLPFTENEFTTVGNDWSAPFSILSESQLQRYQDIAEQVGQAMYAAGWRGLFGIDVIYDEERDNLHLIEINARQPASTSFESHLQTIVRNETKTGITIFEAHLAALLEIPIDETIIEINDGAQIIQRLTHTLITKGIPSPAPLRDAGYIVKEYELTKPNSDVLRIQSMQGIIEAHNKLNSRGKDIIALVTDETVQ